MFDGNHWFLHRVLRRRVIASGAWSLLLLPMSMAAYLFFLQVNLFDPFAWLTAWTSTLCSGCALFSLILLLISLLVVIAFDSRNYTVAPCLPNTRLAMLASIVQPYRFFHTLGHTLAGLLCGWAAAFLSGGRYKSLEVACCGHTSLSVGHGVQPGCLNELHLFIVLFGGFVGFTYSLLYFLKYMSYTAFPIIQLSKYLQFRAALPCIVKQSTKQAFVLLRWYCILYFFFGYIPRCWLLAGMHVDLDSTIPRLDSLIGLLNPGLLFQTWLAGTFILFTWYLAWALLRIHITEAYQFRVETSFVEDSEMCLPVVLASNPPPIVKFLALQDLAILARASPCRRRQVFILSQPGGRPHTWALLSSHCISLLSELTSKLSAHQDATTGDGRAATSSAHGSQHLPQPECLDMHTGLRNKIEGTGFQSSSVTSSPFSPGPLRTPTRTLSTTLSPLFSPRPLATLDTSIHALSSKMRDSQDLRSSLFGSPWHDKVDNSPIIQRRHSLWSFSCGAPMADNPNMGPSIASPMQRAQDVPQPDRGASKLCLVRAFLIKMPIVVYATQKIAESSSQALFADGQAHIWALEAVSHLVAASFTEDQYGVVQTNLSSILCAMVNLLEAIDKHFKLPQASNKPLRLTDSWPDASFKSLRFAVRSALRTALHRISNTFGHHLKAVDLSPEHLKRLQMFVDYKE
uniref:Nucleoporin NDC1 n=1 Tax=Eptatretus burgeri TaxID=7764 RepID=A0A8C4NKX6_EPTBU